MKTTTFRSTRSILREMVQLLGPEHAALEYCAGGLPAVEILGPHSVVPAGHYQRLIEQLRYPLDTEAHR